MFHLRETNRFYLRYSCVTARCFYDYVVASNNLTNMTIMQFYIICQCIAGFRTYIFTGLYWMYSVKHFTTAFPKTIID